MPKKIDIGLTWLNNGLTTRERDRKNTFLLFFTMRDDPGSGSGSGSESLFLGDGEWADIGPKCRFFDIS
jgi:hypothetical protein